MRLASLKQFGASSEKANDDQLGLFNEAEEAESAPDDEAGVGAVNVTVVGEHTRKTPGRKPLPDHLPRMRVEHDLPEDAKVCGCGCRKTKIGEEVSEQLDIIPARVQVLQHVRFKYACRSCEGTDDDGRAVMTAPMPPQPDPKVKCFSRSAGLHRDRQVLRWPAALSPGKDVPADRRDTAARDDGLLDDPLWRSHRAAHRKDA